jgi:predicted metal-dependent phosphoesterase TrpH
MWLADLHVHSNFSDGKHSVAELVDFYGARGFGAIAITDHICEEETLLGRAARYFNRTLTRETFPIYLQTIAQEAARAKKRYNMAVLPGLELTKNSVVNRRSAHVLGLGLSEYLTAEGDPAQLARRIRHHGGLAIAAHPVSTRKLEPQTYYLWSRREELALEFDAWEVASGPHLFDEVLQSGLPMIATSDLHHVKQIESWKTVFDGPREQKNIFSAIRNQNLAIEFYREKKTGE